MKFSIKDFSSKCDQIRRKLENTFTGEILNGKLHFLCSERSLWVAAISEILGNRTLQSAMKKHKGSHPLEFIYSRTYLCNNFYVPEDHWMFIIAWINFTFHFTGSITLNIAYNETLKSVEFDYNIQKCGAMDFNSQCMNSQPRHSITTV